MDYVPTNPRIFPRCKNCKRRVDNCTRASWSIDAGAFRCCSAWEPKSPFLFNALSWLDLQEERWRFWIIGQLDKLDRWCWADLVLWAQRDKPFSEVGRIGGCLDSGNYPYCGKCEKFLPPEGRCENLKNPEWSQEKGMWVEKNLEAV